jgi:chromosome segregation ATPase
MADEPDNMVLVYLRRLDEKVDQVRDDIRELKTRMGRVEVSLADVHGQLAEHSVRFDRLGARLERIERRLELREAATSDQG